MDAAEEAALTSKWLVRKGMREDPGCGATATPASSVGGRGIASLLVSSCGGMSHRLSDGCVLLFQFCILLASLVALRPAFVLRADTDPLATAGLPPSRRERDGRSSAGRGERLNLPLAAMLSAASCGATVFLSRRGV
jgi:hypothetical protein